jgi:AraC family transcriptional regulator
MEKAAGDEDIVFRIGGDEFALLTNSKDINYASGIAANILTMNGQSINYEGMEIPVFVYSGVTRFEGNKLRYDDLFISLHNKIRDCK